MVSKEDKIYLEHILDEIYRVETFLIDWKKEVDYKVVWETAFEDLPALRNQLEKILKQ